MDVSVLRHDHCHARVCRGYLTFERAPESLQKTRPVMIVAENHAPMITPASKRGWGSKLNNLYNLERS
jgi:hypothetical protein